MSTVIVFVAITATVVVCLLSQLLLPLLWGKHKCGVRGAECTTQKKIFMRKKKEYAMFGIPFGADWHLIARKPVCCKAWIDGQHFSHNKTYRTRIQCKSDISVMFVSSHIYIVMYTKHQVIFTLSFVMAEACARLVVQVNQNRYVDVTTSWRYHSLLCIIERVCALITLYHDRYFY